MATENGAILSCTLLLGSFACSVASAEPPADQGRSDHPNPSARRVVARVYRKCHAVCVGVNTYPRLKPDAARLRLQLAYADRDARDVAQVLEEQYGFDVTALVNERATLGAIRKAMHALADNTRVEKDDAVLFYFSGHGFTCPVPEGGIDGFLVASDTEITVTPSPEEMNPAELGAATLPMREIRDVARRTKACHSLFVLDSCHSGLTVLERGMGEKGMSVVVRAPPERGSEDPPVRGLLNQRAERVIVAGTSQQQAAESPEWGHGAFTLKLLQALRTGAANANRDWVTTGSELFSFLQVEVPALIARHPDLVRVTQTPQAASLHGTQGDFMFAHSASEGCASLAGAASEDDAVRNAVQAAVLKAATEAGAPAALAEGLGKEFWRQYADGLRVLRPRWENGQIRVPTMVSFGQRLPDHVRSEFLRQNCGKPTVDLGVLYEAMGRPKVRVNITEKIDRVEGKASEAKVRIERWLRNQGILIYGADADGVDIEIEGTCLSSLRGEVQVDPALPTFKDYTTHLDVSITRTATGERLTPFACNNATGKREPPCTDTSYLGAAIKSIEHALGKHLDGLFRGIASDFCKDAQANRRVDLLFSGVGYEAVRSLQHRLPREYPNLVLSVPPERIKMEGDRCRLEVQIRGGQLDLIDAVLGLWKGAEVKSIGMGRVSLDLRTAPAGTPPSEDEVFDVLVAGDEGTRTLVQRFLAEAGCEVAETKTLQDERIMMAVRSRKPFRSIVSDIDGRLPKGLMITGRSESRLEVATPGSDVPDARN